MSFFKKLFSKKDLSTAGGGGDIKEITHKAFNRYIMLNNKYNVLSIKYQLLENELIKLKLIALRKSNSLYASKEIFMKK